MTRQWKIWFIRIAGLLALAVMGFVAWQKFALVTRMRALSAAMAI